jgi:hypothetical protein
MKANDRYDVGGVLLARPFGSALGRRVQQPMDEA